MYRNFQICFFSNESLLIRRQLIDSSYGFICPFLYWTGLAQCQKQYPTVNAPRKRLTTFCIRIVFLSNLLRVHLTLSSSTEHLRQILFSQIVIVHVTKTCFIKMHFNIIFPFPFWSSLRSLSNIFFHSRSACLSSFLICATCLAYHKILALTRRRF